VFFIILALFSDTQSAYLDKISSLMKRGTLIAILFFVLAMISATGDNAAKVAKAIGGLVFAATLLNTNADKLVVMMDAFFKADWTGTDESANQGQSSTAATNQSANSALQKAENAAVSSANTIGDTATSAFETWFLHLPGPLANVVNKGVGGILHKLGL
jgi:hypothetical protein